MCVCVCVCVRVCVCVSARARACVCVCVRNTEVCSSGTQTVTIIRSVHSPLKSWSHLARHNARLCSAC